MEYHFGELSIVSVARDFTHARLRVPLWYIIASFVVEVGQWYIQWVVGALGPLRVCEEIRLSVRIGGFQPKAKESIRAKILRMWYNSLPM